MDLTELRNNIDRIDRNIVKLLNERFEYVKGVGEWKNSNSHAIYVPEREKALLEKLESINTGPVQNTTLKAIYREVMSGAIALEHPVKIAYLGPENTFSNQAALLKFGKSVDYLPQNSIAEVFDNVEKGLVDYGVVPVENSTEGAVTYTLDIFAQSSCKICAELNFRAHQYLLSKHLDPAEIKTIYSHPQASGQCRAYLFQNFPNAQIIECRSTADAALKASKEDGAAAIASSLAAEAYALNILEEKVEDRSHNVTRFIIISKQDTVPTGDDKTSIMFSVKDRIGALQDCLKFFSDNDISMTMIESRPSKSQEEQFNFFVDFHGHIKEETVELLMEKLATTCQRLKHLGSYPLNKDFVG